MDGMIREERLSCTDRGGACRLGGISIAAARLPPRTMMRCGGGGGERDAEAMRMLREEIARLLPHRQGAVAPSIAVEEPRVD
jgi:hypothetical protein